MRTALVAVALLLPSISAAQQGIKHERLSIAATNDEWTTTSIEAARGDVILVLAAGRIRIGQVSGEVGPNGNSSGNGALQIKISRTPVTTTTLGRSRSRSFTSPVR